MSDISDKWSCPNCTRTWTRRDEQRFAWAGVLRTIQITHGKHCKKGKR